MIISDFNPEIVVNTIKRILPENRIIPLHEPSFIGNEWRYVKECIDTGWVSSVGKYVDRFESMLCIYTGAKRAIAVMNGTAALHMCLKLVGVEQNDEVFLPTLTFVATANAVTYCGAMPHFVDSEEETLGLDPMKLSDYLKDIAEIRRDGCYNRVTSRRIKAVIPVHVFGHPVDMDPLVEICDRYRLELIEDAAESLGSYYKERHTGRFGKVASLSFNGNKIVTTGGGGAILTDDEKLADEAKHLTTTAKLPHPWEYRHDRIGYNYRMPNINAAIGCAQLENLPVFVEKKRALALKYHQAFEGLPGIRLFREPDFAKSNYWLNVLLLEEAFSNQLNVLLEMSTRRGIMTRPAWVLMHKLDIFRHCPKMKLDTAENLESRILNLPSSSALGVSHE